MKRLILSFYMVTSMVAVQAKELPVFAAVSQYSTEVRPLDSKVARALREALSVGVDSAVTQVSSLDGFYKDALIKILLPPEASQLIEKLNRSRTGKKLYQNTLEPVVNDLIMSMNRAAEDASKSAAPIFLKAIKEITIPDAVKILTSADTAATHYLKTKTYDSLTVTFQPTIQSSLDKKLVGNQSTSDLWRKFINTYNEVRKSPASMFLRLDAPTEPDLGKYVTQKALDGVFFKVGEEEKKIRKDPAHQVTNLLKNVFGKLTKKSSGN